MIPIKLKNCAYCFKPRKIFRTADEGPQCYYCYQDQVRDEYFENLKTGNTRRGGKKNKKKNEKQLTLESADSRFSMYIRFQHAFWTEGGPTGRTRMIKCYTCDKVLPFGQMQCGHFMSRKHMYTRWLPDNCRPQCQECNEFKNGNLEEFEKRLEAESPGTPEQLRLLARKVWAPSENDLRDIIANIGEQMFFVTR